MVFGNSQSNGVIQFYPGPSLVAMAKIGNEIWDKMGYKAQKVILFSSKL